MAEYNLDKIRKLSVAQLSTVVDEVRARIVDVVSRNGGHLGASLGVVELTVALHYVYQTPHDQLVWDVGHQAYGHKILTGRNQAFENIRKPNGISGFPKRSESEFDVFGTGHSSTSISAVLGMAIADAIKGIEREHVAIIGDASIQAGMAFEAFNHAGDIQPNITIILNDNRMSIDESVGALNHLLDSLRKEETNGGNVLGFTYLGPIDGHDTGTLVKYLQRAKKINGPVLLHIRTVKGKGYLPAEVGDATHWHAPGIFDKETGKVLLKPSGVQAMKFQDVFGEKLVELATNNENIVAITAGMPTGTSVKKMMNAFPKRAFDVGIAEQHALTLAAGMACNGLLPVVGIYSTFLQRAYDQFIHDIALQELKVIFGVDRAGLVGNDGGTHQGVFDLAYLKPIPNTAVLAPMDGNELANMLDWAVVADFNGPIVLRYPRGGSGVVELQKSKGDITLGKGRYLTQGEKIAVVSIGAVGIEVQEALKQVETSITHFDLRFAQPLDTQALKEIITSHATVITIEDGSLTGGVGERIANMAESTTQVVCLGVGHHFVEQASQKDQRAQENIDAEAILRLFADLL